MIVLVGHTIQKKSNKADPNSISTSTMNKYSTIRKRPRTIHFYITIDTAVAYTVLCYKQMNGKYKQ